MSIKKHIPNILTLINLFSGCILVYSAIFYSLAPSKHPNEFINVIAIFLCISLVADLLDGMVARWLNVTSPIGLQLDSLADMVTFGVFPGFLMAKMLRTYSDSEYIAFPSVAFCGLFITLFSALRLAKFNVDTTQTSYFKGLATPANTILIFGVYIISSNLPLSFLQDYALNTLIGITAVSSYLLIADIPLFSFKFKSKDIKSLLPQIILIIVSILLLIFMGLKALAPIILVYILLSIIFKRNFVNA